MAFASPEQQSAARQMKQVKLYKSAKPGKIDKHGASLARRSTLTHRAAVQKINQLIAQLRWNVFSERVQACAERPLHLKKLLQKLLAALKELFYGCFTPALAGGPSASGGGASNLPGGYSGADPPAHGNRLFNIIKTKTILTAFTYLFIAAAAVPMKAESALISYVDIGQAGGNSGMTFDFQNNDAGTTYDSAKMDFGTVLEGIANAVQQNNSDYVNKTVKEIMNEWGGVQVRAPPTGEVYNGWNAGFDSNTGIANIAHGQFNVTLWTDTTQNSGDYDTMAISVNFHDQLDFNHNNFFDAATEAIVASGQTVNDAFVATTTTGGDIPADAQAYNVVPEPATMGLLLGGLFGLLSVRRFMNQYKN